MAKTKKNTSFYFTILKIFLFLVVVLVVFFQVKRIDLRDFYKVHIDNFWLIISTIILLPLNYFFEWLKWKEIVKSFKSDFATKTNFHAFFAGIITGMLTPNMQGNFIGRLYYYPRKLRINIIQLTLLANFGQFISTLVLGVFAATIIGVSHINLSKVQLIIILVLLIISVIIFLSYEKWILRISKSRIATRINQITTENKGFRTKILLWSVCRNFVFSFQFLLVLTAFEANLFSIENYLLIWQIYFWTTLAPSLFFGKIIIRESIALWLFGGIISNQIEIVFASFIVWLINLLLPTLIGIFICKRAKQ